VNWILSCREALEQCWSLLVQAANTWTRRRELVDEYVRRNKSLIPGILLVCRKGLLIDLVGIVKENVAYSFYAYIFCYQAF